MRGMLGWMAWVLVAARVLGQEVKFPDPVRVALWPEGAPDGAGGVSLEEKPAMTVYRPPQPNGMAVVICPGGGYGGLVTGAEGQGIARWLYDSGITGVVLEYRLPVARSMVPLLDVQRAIRLTRHHAAAWGLETNRVGVMGFSAGGHLAATAATHFDRGVAGAKDVVSRQGSRPDFAVLVYPVITMGPQTHDGSKRNLLGTNTPPARIRWFSCEEQVKTNTPPVFLAHAVDDRAVTIENSRLFAAALKAKGVPHRLLELPDGDHGLNGYKGASWDAWQRESLIWMQALGRP
jgi:acetyl esterase/lipase